MSRELSIRERRQAWIGLIESSYSDLRVMARKLTASDPQPEEDLVQDTILRCLKYAPDLKNIEDPIRYLYRTMRNLLFDRRRKHEVVSLDDPTSSELEKDVSLRIEPRILSLLEEKELIESFRESLRGPLTLEEKELLKLMLEGLDSNEIAEILREDVRLTRYNCNALKAKLRYRVKKKLRADNLDPKLF